MPRLPILEWIKTYNQSKLSDDAVAAVIVTIMLIPQSLAYAMLVGLPPEVGLYASILPLVAYALFGSTAQGILCPANERKDFADRRATNQ